MSGAGKRGGQASEPQPTDNYEHQHICSDHGINPDQLGELEEIKANARLIAAAPETKAQRDELLVALRLMQSHYNDLSNSNPGFMAKLVLQNYALWNEACMAMDGALARAEGKEQAQ